MGEPNQLAKKLMAQVLNQTVPPRDRVYFTPDELAAYTAEARAAVLAVLDELVGQYATGPDSVALLVAVRDARDSLRPA